MIKKRSKNRNACRPKPWLFALTVTLFFQFGPAALQALADETIPELFYYAQFPDGHRERREFTGTKQVNASGEEYFKFSEPIKVEGKRKKETLPVKFTFHTYRRSTSPEIVGVLGGEDEFKNKIRVTFYRKHFVVEVALLYKSGPLKGQFTKFEVKNEEQLTLYLPFNSPALHVFPQAEES